MINKRYTYWPVEDSEDEVWDYPSLEDDEAIERFIEIKRTEFRKEWFLYLEAHGYYD